MCVEKQREPCVQEHSNSVLSPHQAVFSADKQNRRIACDRLLKLLRISGVVLCDSRNQVHPSGKDYQFH